MSCWFRCVNWLFYTLSCCNRQAASTQKTWCLQPAHEIVISEFKFNTLYEDVSVKINFTNFVLSTPLLALLVLKRWCWHICHSVAVMYIWGKQDQILLFSLCKHISIDLSPVYVNRWPMVSSMSLSWAQGVPVATLWDFHTSAWNAWHLDVIQWKHWLWQEFTLLL